MIYVVFETKDGLRAIDQIDPAWGYVIRRAVAPADYSISKYGWHCAPQFDTRTYIYRGKRSAENLKVFEEQ